MRTITGIITVAQEGRFRLIGDDGHPMQFTLSHKAAVEPQDLGPLQQAQARVTVHYDPSESLIAGIVHRIDVHERTAKGGRTPSQRGAA
jgi:hypothetical protein